jgi:hypothetical protein
MKAPSYLDLHGPYTGPEGLYVTVHLRRWHPSFWPVLWRALPPMALWAKLYGWLFVMLRAHR